MKRFYFVSIALTIAISMWSLPSVSAKAADASGTVPTQIADAGAPDFGSPPSGEIPILFNDRHVYANPDTLRQGRVLAALVKNGQLLVPLRSMFEQMGATVTYDGASKSVKASKPGSEVQVTLGKNEVLINGESRPLDVPPMMYKGVMLVPVRVISEALGAYVQWVPEQRVCVVRYIPPTPVPTPPPTPVPTPAPTPPPATPKPIIGFLQGGYGYGRNYNAYAGGANGQAWVASGAYYLGKFALAGNWRENLNYQSSGNSPLGTHFTQFNTIDGGVATIPQFTAKNSNLDGRLEYEILKPKIMFGLGYIQESNSYGNPTVRAGGVGLEKLPDFGSNLGWYGSFFYYPNTRGVYTVPTGPHAGVNYTTSFYTYKADIGIDYEFAAPIYIYLGYGGIKMAAKQASPIGETYSGPYVGLGVKL